MIFKCYNDHSLINSEIATSIYRLNKRIKECINDNRPIDKKAFDKIADFQTISFTICRSIHSLIKMEFGEDIKCEVTIMIRNEDSYVKMIAYANNDNRIPSSYAKPFNLKSFKACFIDIFNDQSGEIYCLINKEETQTTIKKLKGSESREAEICQYIGIPIKTSKNKIELLLQIDVSKDYVFGKTKEEVKTFSKNVFYPYATLLYKSYERDLIFNGYYNMVISSLSKKTESIDTII